MGEREDAALIKQFRGMFDLAVARAVVYLPDLLRLVYPYLKKGGFLISYKSPSDDEMMEGLQAAEKIGFRYLDKQTYGIGDGTDGRCLLIFERRR